MPIYEYVCADCGKRSTALLARFDSPDPACPHCGKAGLRRQISTFATIGGSDDGGDDGADFGEDAYDGGGDDFGDSGYGGFDDDF